MRWLKTVAAGVIVLGLGAVMAGQVSAYPAFALKATAACAVCHVNPAGGAVLTDPGKAYKADGKAPAAAAVKGADYVGAKMCSMCHPKEYKSWQETKHAKAFAGLSGAPESTIKKMAAMLKIEVKGSPATVEGCVRCHVTGYKLTGGYPRADNLKNAAVENVTCEACHGPGSKHKAAALADKKKMINRMVSAALCTQCHTAEITPGFKFEEYKARGVHKVEVKKAAG